MARRLFTLDSFKNIYLKIRSKGLLVTVAIAAALFFVLTSGVGVTLAATGVIQFPSITQTPSQNSSPAEQDLNNKEVLNLENTKDGNIEKSNGEFPDGINEKNPVDHQDAVNRLNKLQQSGWVGAKISFYTGGYTAFFSGKSTSKSDTSISYSFFIDGIPSGRGTYNCGYTINGQTCPGTMGGPIDSFYCKSGAKNYQLKVWGMGINFDQSGVIPAGTADCPAPETAMPAPPAPETLPSAPVPSEPEPEPSPSSSEVAPDPSSSPSPTY